MSVEGILIYCLRAGAFAAALCGAYALLCLLAKRRLRPKRIFGLAYAAALVQITVLRGGVDWAGLAGAERSAMQLIPLKTTLEALGDGAWPFIYHTAGNLAWFLPCGMLLGRRRAACALAAGAGISACIELLQHLLMTGAADIDDLILNALGSLLGWALYRVAADIKEKHCG